MEHKRDLIIKALECCKTTTPEDCIECPYRNKGNSLYTGCVNTLVKDTLSLIKELTEENERLRADNDEICDNICCLEIDIENARVHTVRKMHSEIKERCIKGGIYPAFVANVVDQIAKEMVEAAYE